MLEFSVVLCLFICDSCAVCFVCLLLIVAFRLHCLDLFVSVGLIRCECFGYWFIAAFGCVACLSVGCGYLWLLVIAFVCVSVTGVGCLICLCCYSTLFGCFVYFCFGCL